MKIRILSWNVRGANDSDKRRVIKSVIKSKKVDVVCLQETKIKEMRMRLVRSLGVGRHLDWRAINSSFFIAHCPLQFFKLPIRF